MALSKPALLKALIAHSHGLPNRFRPAPPIRFFSFSSPEEAAAERRRRKRRLRMEPPLGSLQRSHQTSSPPPNPENPNAPKLPEPVSALSGKRLDLHKKILNLIRENDLEEAALFTKHSVYSNCRPTIYTVNAVLTAQLRQSKYGDLLTLHRFSNSAGIVPTVGTYNLLFQTYLDCGKPEMALDYYKQMVNEAPFSPSPATYRVLIKGLVDNGLVDRAVELKDEMVELKGFSPDPIVCHYLMTGFAREKDADRVFKVYEEFKERWSGVDGDGVVEDGTVYGGLMKGYFLRGMEKEAMECYEFAVGENSKVRMNDVAYNSVLDALAKYHESDEVLKLFDRMLSEHNPPLKLSVNLGSFNVMVDWYCARGRFKDAIEVFKRMEAYGCVPDVLSFNNLIDQLCANGLLVEAEEVYGEMDKKGVRPDEYTFGVLMDTCFKEGRIDDGAAYFNKMVDLELRPNLAVYGRMVDHLMKAGKLDQAKSCYDLMVKKLKMDNASYKFMMGVLSDAGRLDDMLKMVGEMLDDETIGLDEELREFVKGELRKDGREDDLGKLIEDKERQKAEAKAREVEEAEATKRNARAAIASLFPPKSANKEGETGTEETNQDSAATAPTSEESPQIGNAGDVEELSSSADLNSTDDAMKA